MGFVLGLIYGIMVHMSPFLKVYFSGFFGTCASFFALFFLWANYATAHVRWFADAGVSVPEGVSRIAPVMWWILVSCAVVVGAFFLNRSTLYRDSFLGRGAGSARIAKFFPFFSGVIGFFLVFSAVDGFIFSQNLTLFDSRALLIVMEAMAGILLATGFFVRVGAFLLGALWLLAFTQFPAVLVLENVWALGVALYVYFAVPAPFSAVSDRVAVFLRRAREYAGFMLRVPVGLNLLILGFSEKILNPELGLAFLSTHDWNFMRHLGIDFSDYAFVISAGFTEALFGLLFMLGLVTRANALIAGVLFFIPLFILGPAELAGHVPYFFVIAMLFLLGNDERRIS